MKRFPLSAALLPALLALLLGACHEQPQPPSRPPLPQTAAVAAQADFLDRIARAYAEQRGNLQVEGWGTVQKVLKDDTRGTRHQRFLLRLENGLTLLVAHNIDLAPRIDGLRSGDRVDFAGEYEWNAKGGVLHWTHRDPRGRHPDGWLQHGGQRYQ